MSRLFTFLFPIKSDVNHASFAVSEINIHLLLREHQWRITIFHFPSTCPNGMLPKKENLVSGLNTLTDSQFWVRVTVKITEKNPPPTRPPPFKSLSQVDYGQLKIIMSTIGQWRYDPVISSSPKN